MSRVKHPDHYNHGIEMWDYAHSHELDFFEDFSKLSNFIIFGGFKAP